MSTVGCHRVNMDAVDECLSLSVDTMDTYLWMGQAGEGGGRAAHRPPATSHFLWFPPLQVAQTDAQTPILVLIMRWQGASSGTIR